MPILGRRHLDKLLLTWHLYDAFQSFKCCLWLEREKKSEYRLEKTMIWFFPEDYENLKIQFFYIHYCNLEWFPWNLSIFSCNTMVLKKISKKRNQWDLSFLWKLSFLCITKKVFILYNKRQGKVLSEIKPDFSQFL